VAVEAARRQQRDPADRADRHRTCRRDLGRGGSEQGALGGEAADDGAAAGRSAGRDRQQAPESGCVLAQRLAVRAARGAAAHVAANRLVMTAAVGLGRDRRAGGGARQLGRLAVPAQTDPGASDQTAHRLFVGLEQIRDLTVRVARQLAHQQRGPLALGELPDAGDDRLEFVPHMSRGVGPPSRDGLGQVAVDDGPRLAPAREVDRGVARDPYEPCLELTRRRRAEGHRQRRERLLGGVLGVVTRAEHADADREHARAMALEQDRERGLVPIGEPLRQRCI
jgi:hypothetical protein